MQTAKATWFWPTKAPMNIMAFSILDAQLGESAKLKWFDKIQLLIQNQNITS
jgi:hypothetical protein